jgi:multidrug efflux pump subunit AcrB
MKISEFAIKNKPFTLIIFLMIAVLGISTLLTMPRSEDPDFQKPSFPVVIIYPGASPEDMEKLVVNPLEKEISALDDMNKVRTTISNGVAVIMADYEYKCDVETKYQEMVRVVDSKRKDLPADIASIEVKKVLASDTNVFQLALISGTAPREKIRLYAKRLQDELEKIKSLKKVEINGLPDHQVRVELDIEKMSQQHISPLLVTENIKANMENIPGGVIEAGTNSFNVKTSGNFKDIDDVRNALVWKDANRNIYLKDIAKVYYGYEDDNYLTRLNNNRCVFIVAAQKDGKNITATRKQYLPVIEQFAKTLPKDIKLVKNFDLGVDVNNRLSGLGMDFVIAILLVSITLLPLGWRAAVIVMISIPLSLAIAVIMLNIFGYNLNQLSIVGLVVALGLLVDDSIVVVENIERWILEGHNPLDAAMKGTKQIGLAILGCTATLVIAFLPIVFMPEAAGDFIRGLPMAVIFSVVASMLVALTIIPLLATKLLKSHVGHPDGNIFMRALKKIIHGSYAKWLDHALNRPLLSLSITAVLFIGSLFLFGVIGFTLFPSSEKPQFLINITTPPQSSFTYTNKVVSDVEKELIKISNVRFISANAGKGNPQIYYNEIPENLRQDYGQVFVQLREKTSVKEKLKLMEELRSKFNLYPGAKIEVKDFEQGPPITAPIEVKLFGDNLDSLKILAHRTEEMLKKTDGTMYVTNPMSYEKSDFKAVINKEKALLLGVTPIEIDRTIRLAVAGFDLGEYPDKNESEYNILVTRNKEGKSQLDVLQGVYVFNARGEAIPLNQVVEIKPEISPVSISHQEKIRTVSVKSFVQQGFLADRVLTEVISKMDHFKFPEGYKYSMGGEIETRENSFDGFLNILIATLFLFIAVLVLEFGTLKSSVIVLSVIPLGVIGAVTALWITGYPLSFIAIIGIIALAGIEVKNTILLVDYTNNLRKEGMDIEKAIREAGEVRFLPIVLTSFTAIGGLIPVALSSSPLISPLAIVIIGGLISSTLLSRIVTPVVYKLIPPNVKTREQIQNKLIE